MTDFEKNKVEGTTSEFVSSSGTQFNKKYCKYCGKELQLGAAFCSSCGKPLGNVPIQRPLVQMTQQPVVQPYNINAHQQPQPAAPISTNNTTTVVVEGSHSNSMGIAGFIISLLGLVLCWIPIVDLILWLLGLIFSLIGLFKAPRGMAIAGLVLSLIIIFIIISIWGTIFNALDTFFSK